MMYSQSVIVVIFSPFARIMLITICTLCTLIASACRPEFRFRQGSEEPVIAPTSQQPSVPTVPNDPTNNPSSGTHTGQPQTGSHTHPNMPVASSKGNAKVSIEVNKTGVAVGDTVEFIARCNIPRSVIVWDLGDDSETPERLGAKLNSQTGSMIYQYYLPGNYSVRATCCNRSGLKADATTQVQVGHNNSSSSQKQVLYIRVHSQTVRVNEQARFSSVCSLAGDATTIWHFAGAITKSGTSISHSFQELGSQEVRATCRDGTHALEARVTVDVVPECSWHNRNGNQIYGYEYNGQFRTNCSTVSLCR